MNPLTMLELETRTLVQLYILARLIETIIGENEEAPAERQTTFANRELVRREMKARKERGR